MSEVGSLNVNVGLNSSEFQQGISKINKELKLAQAEFKNAASSADSLGNATQGLQTKANYLTQVVGLQSSKVDQLRAAYEQSAAATGEDSNATQNLAIQLNNAEARLNNLQQQLTNTNNQLALQTNSFHQLGETLQSIGNKMQDVGKKMSEVGKNLTTTVTAPIVGLGTAAAKMSIEFEDSIAKVSTIADSTQVPMDSMRESILKLSSETGIAATDIADNVYNAISAGQSTGDAVNFVTNSTKLAKAGFAEAGQSLDVLTTILNSYGLKSEEVGKVSDILIQIQNKGKTTVGELSSVMGKIIPTANALGVNLEQVGAGYAIMTAKGVAAAESTTYMNSMLNEMGKNGTKASETIKEATGKSFPELIKSGKSVGDVLAIMNDYAQKNNLSLSDMFGSAEAGKAALILSTNAGKDFNNMIGEMQGSVGATDEAFKKVSNTTGEEFKKSINALKNAGIELGDSLVPIVGKIREHTQVMRRSNNQ